VNPVTDITGPSLGWRNDVAEAAVDGQRGDRSAEPLAVGQEAWQYLEAERLDARLGVEHPADVAAHRASFHAQILPGPHPERGRVGAGRRPIRAGVRLDP
jgi:hypothetical protein